MSALDRALERDEAYVNTYNIYPCPGAWIIPAGESHYTNDNSHTHDATPENPQYRPAASLPSLRLKSPEFRKELRVRDQTHEDRMNGEGEIVESHRRLRGQRVSVGIL